MNNKITNSFYNCFSSKPKTLSPNFRGEFNAKTLTNTNIGSCLEGYIGKVKARKLNGEVTFVNVIKKYLEKNVENYSIVNDTNDVLGEITIKIKKIPINKFDRLNCSIDPSHVFVDELRNYSNPSTPYYKQTLEYHKDIGTRLMQIAQRRSDEAQCGGNIKLISKNESKPWYKNVIGMCEEFPIEPNSKMRFCVNNPNAMILPIHSKMHLSLLQGGL